MPQQPVSVMLKKHLSWLMPSKKTNTNDLLVFFKQFTALFSAGVPILNCLTILEHTQTHSSLRQVILTIKMQLLAGHTLHHCLNQHPQHFSPIIYHLIKLGEHTGKLQTMLNTITQHLEKQISQHHHIKQALFYPSIVSLIALIMTFCMVYFVIPRFAILFQESHAHLPTYTQLLFSFSNLLHHGLWLILPSLMITLALLLHPLTTQSIKPYLRDQLSHLPLLKPLIKQLTLARFTRDLAITLQAGLTLTDALTLVSPIPSSPLAHQLAYIRLKIQSGQPLHLAMQASTAFPTLLVQMIKIGETSGNLDNILADVADWLESDLEQQISRLSQLLEPLIMVVLGVLIGGLLIGLYLPIFTLGNAI